MATTLQPGEFCGSVAKSFSSSSMVDSYSMFCLFMQPAANFPRWEVTYTHQSLCWKKSAHGASVAGEKVNMKEECSLIACSFCGPLPPTQKCGKIFQQQFDGGLLLDVLPFYAAGCELPKMGSHLHSSESLLEKERTWCFSCRRES